MRSPGRSLFAYGVAVVLLTTAGCAMLTGASDLTIAAAGGTAGSSEASTAEGGSPSADPEAGFVSSDPDAAGTSDAGVDAPPTIVRCNDADCSGKCCVGESTGICASAEAACPPFHIELACDERADCPSGLVCCLTIQPSGAYARCSASCPIGANATMCRNEGECAGPLGCEPLTEFGIGPTHGFGACQ